MLQIVIPAYNEERRLPQTLRALRRHLTAGVPIAHEVIVVDNGSHDDTAAVARAESRDDSPVRVVHCAVRGKGAAVRAGLLATDADVVCFMDADGATDLSALDVAAARLAAGADVVIGSRRLADSVTEVRHCRTRSVGADWYRRVTSRLLPEIRDTQCGFKAFRGDLVRQAAADLRTRGFSFDVELLLRLRGLGARVTEVPVVWTDVPGSTFVPSRHGFSAFAELGLIAWRVRPTAAAPVAVAGPIAAGVDDASRSGARRPLALPAAAVAMGLAVSVTAQLQERR